jgi:hypothetical protein
VSFALADNTRSTYANFLYELQGSIQEVFPSEAPFLAEISGFDVHQGIVDRASAVKRITSAMDANRDRINGKWIRHTIILSGLTGGGPVSETGTWPVPHTLNTTEAHINLCDMLWPISVSVDLERDSQQGSGSAASAVATLLDQASKALARQENLVFLGDGTGLVATVSGAGGSPGLTVPVAAGSNFDVLLPGTVWDIATRSTAVAVTGGKRRKIASVNESGLTVTFDTNAVASDGDSGNITFSANEGLYVINGASTAANAGTLVPQGLLQAVATTGTFENINKANVQQWQGTDGRGGDTTSLALSANMLDGAVRRGRRAGIGAWDFGIGDPAVIDLYKQGLYASVRYEPNVTTLKSGFSGIAYDGADKPFPLIKEPMAPKGSLFLIDKSAVQLYGDNQGPTFLDDDGAMFRRFSRTLPKEADLLDRVQLGFTKVNTLVFLNNLASAS